jgi:NAD(P)-dependent dehydrogenase (short-subunit alcohol dehydrogenase family)
MTERAMTAVITGASRGIGLSIAEALCRDGLRLIIVGRNQQTLDATQYNFAKAGISIETFAADVTNEAEVERLVQHAGSTFEHVDVLVNNSGSAASSPFTQTELSAFNSMIESNLTSTFLCMKAFLPGMVRRNFGRIVNVSSIAGKIGFRYTSGYCAAKHAVLGLTRAVALEVARKGVTVNAVCPGWVDTPMTTNTISNIAEKTGWPAERASRFLEEQSPLNRLIAPEEVSATVKFLISPAASAINGQAINVCGGQIFV